MATAGPVRGQNATTYNVTFGGFLESAMNTTVNVASLPQTFTAVVGNTFLPWFVLSDDCYGFTGASLTSGGEGKVSADIADWNQMTITVTGTFEGTATIHVEGDDAETGSVSRDITVSCVVAPQPHTVRMAAGAEDAANWSLSSGNASVPGTQVLENVMSGSELTATYNGTQKVKSVTLGDEVVLVNIDGITLDITGCTTWADIIARNPGVIWEFNGLVDSNEGMLNGGDDTVYTSDTYNPSENYEWLF